MNIKLIIKGILLWVTGIATALFITSVDSLWDNELFFKSLICITLLILTCWSNISEEELKKLTLHNWFEKLLKTDKQ